MRILRIGPGWQLTMTQRFPMPPEDLFPFFADARNLEAITPPWLSFEVLTPEPIELRPGALIDYRLRLRRLPIRWRTRIVTWEPPHRFVDEQIKGPYRKWLHEHSFEPAQGGGTLATDTVDYELYGGPLGALLNRLSIERDIRAIFTHRAKVLAERFGGEGKEE